MLRRLLVLLIVVLLPWQKQLQHVLAGHEVLHSVSELQQEQLSLRAQDIAVLQFDSRPLQDYWNISARWNRAYCQLHGHQYLFLSLPKAQSCRALGSADPLAAPWCKVQAMLYAMQAAPTARAFLYIDSDALLTVNHSLSVVLSYIRHDLHWDWQDKPIVFNQDGPGWACKLAFRLQYSICLNSGTVFWFRSPKATEVLEAWWTSAGDDLRSIPFRMNWKLKWPWEQAQQYEIYQHFKNQIMIFSFPNLPYLPWTSTKNPKSQYPTDTVEPWCFSHWLGANCFITHFCASPRQKQKMRQLYDTVSDTSPIEVTFIPSDS